MKVQDDLDKNKEDDEYGTQKIIQGTKHRHKKVHKVIAQSPPP